MTSAQAAIYADSALVADCWNKIGVRGDASCPELAKQIHCRNCPKYSAAASLLLDRDLPPDYREEWRIHFSREHVGEDRDEKLDSKSIVVFRIGDEWLALPTGVFVEFIEMRAIHTLPHRRHGILLGLTNVRGELLICVALDKVLGVNKESTIPRQRSLSKRLVVIRDQHSRIVFPVDEVQGILRFHPDELMPVPATVAKASHTKAILPWGDQAIAYLDEALLFYSLQRSLA